VRPLAVRSTTVRWRIISMRYARALVYGELRGTHFVTRSLRIWRRGVPLNIVQALLGHSMIVMTMRYAHVAPSSMRAAIELLNPARFLAGDFGQPAVNHWTADQQRRMQESEARLRKAA
jgi:integrase